MHSDRIARLLSFIRCSIFTQHSFSVIFAKKLNQVFSRLLSIPDSIQHMMEPVVSLCSLPPPFSVVTARKRSWRKIMFLHLSVILFTERGWVVSLWVEMGVSLGRRVYTPFSPPDTQPPGHTQPPWLDTQHDPHTAPLDSPTRNDTPPMVDKRAVCILLKCFLGLQRNRVKPFEGYFRTAIVSKV